jgi:outer membrane protein assembly factor BamD (BamD/ComL family)
MKERIKNKSFLQVPITIWIVLVIVAIGIGYGTGEYFQTSKIIKEAEELTKEEKYDEAIWKLEILKNTLFGKILSQKINTELEKNKRLLEDKMEYTQGLEEFNKENWEQAKELLSKVSENSPYYQDAKNKIEEAQQKIIEERVTEIVKKETERAKKNIIGVEPEIKGYQTSEIF